MDQEEIEKVDWVQLAIVCPHCGNRGARDGAWEMHSSIPFKLIEEVIRSYPFVGRIDGGSLSLIADVECDSVDWESGKNLRFECMQCFGDFPLPDDVQIDFD